MDVGPWGFLFFLPPIHITRQMMFSQNPETKIRFLDSGFSPVSANSRIALSFDLRPSMNDRSKWKKKEGEGKKATTPAYSETIMFDEFGHRYVPFWSVLKGIYGLHIKLDVAQKLFRACVKTVGETRIVKRIYWFSLFFSLPLFHTHTHTLERAPSAELTRSLSNSFSLSI